MPFSRRVPPFLEPLAEDKPKQVSSLLWVANPNAILDRWMGYSGMARGIFGDIRSWQSVLLLRPGFGGSFQEYRFLQQATLSV